MAAKTILVVDDEQDILAITTKILEHHGYEVHAFSQPLKALEHVKNDCKDCDILLSDVRMPGMTGFELVKAVKNIRPDIKVMLFSSFAINKEEWRRVMPSIAVDQFLSKPFHMHQLVNAVKNCEP